MAGVVREQLVKLHWGDFDAEGSKKSEMQNVMPTLALAALGVSMLSGILSAFSFALEQLIIKTPPLARWAFPELILMI